MLTSSVAFCSPPALALPSSRRAFHICSKPHTKHARPRAPRALNHSPNPRTPPSNPRAPDYFANIGTVIDTLRADYPSMLITPPDLSIYTPEVSFADASGNRLYGIRAYSYLFWALRTQAALFFVTHCISIQSLYHEDSAGAISVRWRAHLFPRTWTLLSHQRGIIIDGISVYKLDTRGFVYEHSLENTCKRRTPRQALERVLAIRHVPEAKPVAAGMSVESGPPSLPSWYTSSCSETHDGKDRHYPPDDPKSVDAACLLSDT